jgi:DNA-binding transcriptional LysR family regulator
MELRHLRYVVAVAEELHFGRAAARLNMSQPPLSQQIRQLEEEIGTKLFRRTNRQVRLTEAGEAFVREARQILAQAEHAAKIAVQASKGEIGQLTVATVTSTDSGFFRIVVAILRAFAARYPNVRLVLRSLNPDQQIQALREGRIQIGFLTLPVEDEQLAIEWVCGEPLMLAMPENHPLAKRPRIPLRTLASEPHIMFSRSMFPGYYDLIVSSCRNEGFSLNIVHEADAIYTILALVAAGLGVSLLPASIRETPREGIVFRKIQGPLPQIEMGAAYRRDAPSNVLRSFLDVVRAVTAKAGSLKRGRRNSAVVRQKVRQD